MNIKKIIKLIVDVMGYHENGPSPLRELTNEEYTNVLYEYIKNLKDNE